MFGEITLTLAGGFVTYYVQEFLNKLRDFIELPEKVINNYNNIEKEQMNQLVSIITPSYNCGKYIHRLLDSVLSQTYQNIEMFVIDDGSTDNSKEIIEKYIEKFEKTGKKLKYIYQENKGAPCAINTGLKYIDGKYFVWPDADDWYATDDAIEQLVYTFENSPDNVGFVRGLQYIIDEKNFKVIGTNGGKRKEYPDNLFDSCIDMIDSKKYFWFPPGAYMIKTEHLFCNYPDKDIFYLGINENYGGGQNLPLLIPSLYKYKSITIKKFIYNILSRKDSVSRKKRSYDWFINRRYVFLENILKNTILSLKEMPSDVKEIYIKNVSIIFNILRFLKAFQYKQKNDCSIYYNKILSEDKGKAKKYKFKYILSQNYLGFVVFFVDLLKRAIKFLKRKIYIYENY